MKDDAYRPMDGRTLQVGDTAWTDFEGSGCWTRVQITRRLIGQSSQSGVLFQVAPQLRNTSPSTLLDADWFNSTPLVGSRS